MIAFLRPGILAALRITIRYSQRCRKRVAPNLGDVVFHELARTASRPRSWCPRVASGPREPSLPTDTQRRVRWEGRAKLREALGHVRSWSGESRWGVQYLAKCRGVASELTFGKWTAVKGKRTLVKIDKRVVPQSEIIEGFVSSCGWVVAHRRSEERRVGKECRSRWSPYH